MRKLLKDVGDLRESSCIYRCILRIRRFRDVGKTRRYSHKDCKNTGENSLHFSERYAEKPVKIGRRTSEETRKSPRQSVRLPSAEGLIYATYFCSTVAPHLKRTSMRSSHTMMASTSAFMISASTLASFPFPDMLFLNASSHAITAVY